MHALRVRYQVNVRPVVLRNARRCFSRSWHLAGAAALWSLSARPLVARAHSLTGTFVDKRGA